MAASHEELKVGIVANGPVNFDGCCKLYSATHITIPKYSTAAVDVNIVNILLPHHTFGLISTTGQYIIGGGVIDEDYRGVLKVLVVNNLDVPEVIDVGTHVANLTIHEYGEAKFVSDDVDIKIPTKAHETDAGYDVCCHEPVTIKPTGHTTIVVPVKIMDVPINAKIVAHSRSGLSLKKSLVAITGPMKVGGFLTFTLINFGDRDISFVEGEKLTQIVIHRSGPKKVNTIILDKVDIDTKRGTGGFGSTGI